MFNKILKWDVPYYWPVWNKNCYRMNNESSLNVFWVSGRTEALIKIRTISNKLQFPRYLINGLCVSLFCNGKAASFVCWQFFSVALNLVFWWQTLSVKLKHYIFYYCYCFYFLLSTRCQAKQLHLCTQLHVWYIYKKRDWFRERQTQADSYISNSAGFTITHTYRVLDMCILIKKCEFYIREMFSEVVSSGTVANGTMSRSRISIHVYLYFNRMICFAFLLTIIYVT